MPETPTTRLQPLRQFLAMLALVGLSGPATAQPREDFTAWLAVFRVDARAAGISPATLDAALTDLQPLTRAIELDGRQPEFQSTFTDYLDRRVTADQVSRGQQLLEDNAAEFDRVEARYGVQKSILAAFWAMETNYGRTLGRFNIPASLATLAWEGRRSKFFRHELIEALRIIDAGHIAAPDMVGSWAGAMGQMQFMPSTFKAYARDGNGDGRIDLWGSLPDALDSAGNFLMQMGWRAGEPAALEVRLPPSFDVSEARANLRLPVAAWTARGVVPMRGDTLPLPDSLAAIVLPQGHDGPAFMIYPNFDRIMRWNRSTHYALSVAQMANQLAGAGPMVAGAGSEARTLSTVQIAAMQQLLNELGYNTGAADGILGPMTQAVLREFQKSVGLPADGYPAMAVLQAIDDAHTQAAAEGMLMVAAPPAPQRAE